jgi:hypothetical protein
MNAPLENNSRTVAARRFQPPRPHIHRPKVYINRRVIADPNHTQARKIVNFLNAPSRIFVSAQIDRCPPKTKARPAYRRPRSRFSSFDFRPY